MLAEALLAIAAGVLLLACVHQVADAVPAGDESLCDRLAAERGAECATVRQFAKWVTTEWPYRHLELCVPDRLVDAAELEHGPSWPSDDDRLQPYAYAGVDPPCFYACPGIVGGNALDGTYCPTKGVPPQWYPATWEAPAVLCVEGTHLTFATNGGQCL